MRVRISHGIEHLIILGLLAAGFLWVIPQTLSYHADGAQAEMSAEINAAECDEKLPPYPVYGAQFVATRKPFRIEPEEEFTTKIFLRNTGNIPWFSSETACGESGFIELRSDRSRNHTNVFTGTSRFPLKNSIVRPNEIGTFEIQMLSPERSDLYREFFTPVIIQNGSAKEEKWLTETLIKFDMWVGDLEGDIAPVVGRAKYLLTSAGISDINLSDEKTLDVDLSEQKLRVKAGEEILYEFPISTGKRKTPTPRGETKILLKQKVRVAGKAPYYIMPKFMMFKGGGYGFHALPSLGNAKLRAKLKGLKADEDAPVEWFQNDSFWTEALNHIGTPRSHGCIRLLPEHAQVAYEFTDVGTKVVVHD